MQMPQQRYRAIYAEAFQRCMKKTIVSGRSMHMNAVFLKPDPGYSELMVVYHLQGKQPWEIEMHKTHFHVGQTRLIEVTKDHPVNWKTYTWLIEPDGTVLDVSSPLVF